MFSALRRFLSLQWTWYVQQAVLAWTAISPSSSLTATHDPRLLMPPTRDQEKQAQSDFIKAIDRDLVCALASFHNNALPCRLDESRTAHGSFNVCFFAHFESTGQTWVVRVPVEPAVHSVWVKVQSEVCTMRYLRDKTRIPIPHIHAVGCSRLLRNASTKQAFIIMDCVQGHPLTEKELLGSESERRLQFYAELIDVLAQLRTSHFPAGGSLRPRWLGFLKPAVGGTLSIPLNQLQTDGLSISSEAATSTMQFVHDQCRVLHAVYEQPTEDMELESAQKEIFALNAIKSRLPTMVADSPNGSFVLTHTDLRFPNIMVDDDLHIQGIIDWEWACTVPKELFTPPSWIVTSRDILGDFRSVVKSKCHESKGHQLLAHEWTPDNDVMMHVAAILRGPTRLTSLFYWRIYPKWFSGPVPAKMDDFFADPIHKAELDEQMLRSEQYTQYLKDNDLYVSDDESTKKWKEWVAKAPQFLKDQGLA